MDYAGSIGLLGMGREGSRLAGGRPVLFERPGIDVGTHLTEEMAPHVLVPEDASGVHFAHRRNKVVVLGVQPA